MGYFNVWERLAWHLATIINQDVEAANTVAIIIVTVTTTLLTTSFHLPNLITLS